MGAELPNTSSSENDTRSREGERGEKEANTKPQEQRGAESAGNEESLSQFRMELVQNADNFLDVADRVVNLIKTRAPYGGLKIGEKIEETEEFKDIQAAREVLTEDVRTCLSSIDSIKTNLLAGEETDHERHILKRSCESIGVVASKIAVSAQDLFGGSIRLRRRVSEYYDGNQNEDEDFLRAVGTVLHDLHDESEKLARLIQVNASELI